MKAKQIQAALAFGSIACGLIVCAFLTTQTTADSISFVVASSDELASSVLWAAGIAAFVGFIFGSVPLGRPNAGWEFDMGGAVVFAMAGALIFGGGVHILTTGLWMPAILAVGFGALLAGVRLINSMPARIPTNCEVKEGINRGEGDTPRAKWKSAKRLYNNASFRNGNSYHATRSPRNWSFGSSGPDAGFLNMLAGSLANANHDQFDILVMLVSELPDEPGQPAVVVVRGSGALHHVKCEADGITVPGYDKKIPAKSISQLVGYAWR